MAGRYGQLHKVCVGVRDQLGVHEVRGEGPLEGAKKPRPQASA